MNTDVLGFVTAAPAISRQKTILISVSFFDRAYLPSYRNPGHISGVMGFVL
jgi:hypothetical protein